MQCLIENLMATLEQRLRGQVVKADVVKTVGWGFDFSRPQKFHFELFLFK